MEKIWYNIFFYRREKCKIKLMTLFPKPSSWRRCFSSTKWNAFIKIQKWCRNVNRMFKTPKLRSKITCVRMMGISLSRKLILFCPIDRFPLKMCMNLGFKETQVIVLQSKKMQHLQIQPMALNNKNKLEQKKTDLLTRKKSWSSKKNLMEMISTSILKKGTQKTSQRIFVRPFAPTSLKIKCSTIYISLIPSQKLKAIIIDWLWKLFPIKS